MRKFMSVFTMILVLLSSGAAQMAYHICEEDGAHLWEDGCHTEAETHPTEKHSCCSSEPEKAVEEHNCCTEAYFFSLSPLPVTPSKFKLESAAQSFQTAYLPSLALELGGTHETEQRFSLHQYPPNFRVNQPDLSGICVWIV
jgi:hypothetical protein